VNVGDQLYARTLDANGQTWTPLGNTYFGSPHRYRIEWAGSQADYYIDNILVATHTSLTFDTPMYAVVSDPANDGIPLVVDWMRMGPYNTACTYTSRVFDKGSVTNWWNNLLSTVDLPAGTAATFQVRFGNTPTPDATWSGFLTPLGGTGINRQERYMQYEVTLNTANSQFTPAVSSVNISYGDTPTAVTMQSLTVRSAGAEMSIVVPAGLLLAAVASYVVFRKR
jgi:hypothetical protein